MNDREKCGIFLAKKSQMHKHGLAHECSAGKRIEEPRAAGASGHQCIAMSAGPLWHICAARSSYVQAQSGDTPAWVNERNKAASR